MTNAVRNVVVLGSTGSIGCSTLEVVAGLEDTHVAAISAHSRLDAAAQQCHEHRIPRLIATDASAVEKFDRSKLPAGTELVTGEDALVEAVSAPDVDAVVSAIVGSAGLRGSWAAIEAGKRVALANRKRWSLPAR